MIENVYVNTIKGVKPKIDLTVQRVEPSVWKNLGFAEHHYLTQEMNLCCRCLLFSWNDQPVAFVALNNTPIKYHPYYMAVSRMVIHPDYQGLGLARKILDFCGGISQNQGSEYALFIKTAHDKMGNMLENNKNWSPTATNKSARPLTCISKTSKSFKHPLLRWSYSYRYTGDVLTGYEDMLAPIEALRSRKELLLMPSLF